MRTVRSVVIRIADQPNLVVASAELSVRVVHPQQKYDAPLATLNKS